MRPATAMACAAMLMGCGLAFGQGKDLAVQLPAGTRVTGAAANATALKLSSTGVADGAAVRFANLLPDTAYDLSITLAGGTILRGVDMGWYNAEAAKADAGAMDEDDREQVRKLVQDVRQFYDRSEILMLQGDHDRAVALVQQIRDSAFHSGKGGEVIWRLEVWYFKNRYGGWERISQQNKVLERERFGSRAQFDAKVKPLRFMPQLGGVRIAKSEPAKTIAVETLTPTTAPAR